MLGTGDPELDSTDQAYLTTFPWAYSFMEKTMKKSRGSQEGPIWGDNGKFIHFQTFLVLPPAYSILVGWDKWRPAKAQEPRGAALAEVPQDTFHDSGRAQAVPRSPPASYVCLFTPSKERPLYPALRMWRAANSTDSCSWRGPPRKHASCCHRGSQAGHGHPQALVSSLAEPLVT